MQRCAALVFGSAADTYEEFCLAAQRLIPDIPLVVRQCMAAAAEMFAVGLRNAARRPLSPPRVSRIRSIERATNTHRQLSPYRRCYSCPPKINILSCESASDRQLPSVPVANVEAITSRERIDDVLPACILNLEPYVCESVSVTEPLFTELIALDSPSSQRDESTVVLNEQHPSKCGSDPEREAPEETLSPCRIQIPSPVDTQPTVALYKIPVKRCRTEQQNILCTSASPAKRRISKSSDHHSGKKKNKSKASRRRDNIW